MPYKLQRATPALVRAHQAAYAPITLTEAVCPNRTYEKLTGITSIPVTNGEFITYSTPDCAFFVTKQRIEAAERSVLIGIYDFTAKHMRDLLLETVSRGVAVTLMLDCNFSDSSSSPEKSIFNELAEAGVRCVRAPSCQGGTRRFFKVAHEKVIVIDDTWTLVQSGNYTNNSLPFNLGDGVNTANFRTGNRDMGVAIKSAEIATFFSRIINGDIQLELGGEEAVPASSELATTLPPLFERATEAVPFDLFPSEKFNPAETVEVLPVLTPDNYMDVVPQLLASATRSIVIEQQYIRNFTFSSNQSIRKLIGSIKSAKEQHPDLRVRIIVAPPFDSHNTNDRDQLRKELDALATVGLFENTHVRLLNKDQLTHCHNKLIIVDGKKTLISSQNWSEPAVTINREAGVIMDHSGIANYFEKVFDEDWDNAWQSLTEARDTELFMLDNPAPDNVRAVLRSGEYKMVEWGDYADV